MKVRALFSLSCSLAFLATHLVTVAHAEMIWIPPGPVRLGQSGIAVPVHDYIVPGFWIDRYEVSNAQYAQCHTHVP